MPGPDKGWGGPKKPKETKLVGDFDPSRGGDLMATSMAGGDGRTDLGFNYDIPTQGKMGHYQPIKPGRIAALDRRLRESP